MSANDSDPVAPLADVVPVEFVPEFDADVVPDDPGAVVPVPVEGVVVPVPEVDVPDVDVPGVVVVDVVLVALPELLDAVDDPPGAAVLLDGVVLAELELPLVVIAPGAFRSSVSLLKSVVSMFRAALESS